LLELLPRSSVPPPGVVHGLPAESSGALAAKENDSCPCWIRDHRLPLARLRLRLGLPGADVHPGGAVPLPGGGEEFWSLPAEEDHLAAGRVVGERVTVAGGGRRPRRSELRPRGAVPLPGITEQLAVVAAPKEDHPLAACVVSQRVSGAPRWRRAVGNEA